MMDGTMNIQQCKQCGSVMDGRKRKYCSKSCMQKAWYARQSTTKICIGCKKSFATNKHAVYCSASCRITSSDCYKSLLVVEQRSCKNCNKEYQSTTLGQVHCCDNCNEAYSNRRKRARRYRAYVEDVTIGEIADRDNYTCQICFEKVDMSLTRFDDWAPQLDHIVPMSKGGKHTKLNTQLAHRLCNGRKGSSDDYLLYDFAGTIKEAQKLY